MTKDLRIQNSGEVFTSASVVCFMLDNVNYRAEHDLSQVTVLEPAAGDGAFAVEIVKRLKASSILHDFCLLEALKRLYFIELDNTNVDRLKKRVAIEGGLSKFEINAINIHAADFLAYEVSSSVDLVIGNPPYVRWDNLSDTYRSELKSKYFTFFGRCDLYVAFYEKGLSLLSSNGILSYLCSNRWFKSAYGKRLRKLIKEAYYLETVIDLETTNPFTADVLGYPAVTQIRKQIANDNVIQFAEIEDLNLLKWPLNYRVLPLSVLKSTTWSFRNDYHQLLSKNRYSTIPSCGFEIKIGIATGKDSVFISSSFPKDMESDRLIPILKASQLKMSTSRAELFVINCFDLNGNLIDLRDYPILANYFEEHKDVLMSRHIAKRKPKQWYRTIDKIRHQDIARKKILLPDISGSKDIYLGGEGVYPHHNIYYITHEDHKHLEILAGILSSTQIRNQLKAIGNTMNGGYPRWQSQNIKRLVIPRINQMSDYWKEEMINAYRKKSYSTLDRLMTDRVIIDNFESEQMMTLFEPSEHYETDQSG